MKEGMLAVWRKETRLLDVARNNFTAARLQAIEIYSRVRLENVVADEGHGLCRPSAMYYCS